MKIAVYSIAKNEEAQVARWAETTWGADFRFVLDTGSSDRTVELLKQHGIETRTEIIQPWRFDVARNLSLAALPEDIDVCVSLDMDEMLSPGWREAIEREWTPGTTLLHYPFRLNEHSRTAVGFKIHARNAYRWRYAVHEVLTPLGAHVERKTDALAITHDPAPGKNRSTYRGLLERMVAEEPDEPRYWYYLGRVDFDERQWPQALSRFERYLRFPEFLTDAHERSFVWRLVAWTLTYLKAPRPQILQALGRAVSLAPGDRELWCHLAEELAAENDWVNVLAAASNALRAGDPFGSYFREEACWDGRKPEKLLENARRKLGLYPAGDPD